MTLVVNWRRVSENDSRLGFFAKASDNVLQVRLILGYIDLIGLLRPIEFEIVQAGVDVDYVRLLADPVLHHDIQPVALADRGNSPMSAIPEQLIELMFGGESEVFAELDLSDVPEARVGSPVVLWGEGMPVDDVASAASTVGYELLCALAPRVPVVVSDLGPVDLEL